MHIKFHIINYLLIVNKRTHFCSTSGIFYLKLAFQLIITAQMSPSDPLLSSINTLLAYNSQGISCTARATKTKVYKISLTTDIWKSKSILPQILLNCTLCCATSPVLPKFSSLPLPIISTEVWFNCQSFKAVPPYWKSEGNYYSTITRRCLWGAEAALAALPFFLPFLFQLCP